MFNFACSFELFSLALLTFNLTNFQGADDSHLVVGKQVTPSSTPIVEVTNEGQMDIEPNLQPNDINPHGYDAVLEENFPQPSQDTYVEKTTNDQ